MLLMIVQAAIPIKETDERISALMFLIVVFLWILTFHFGSVLRIMNLE